MTIKPNKKVAFTGGFFLWESCRNIFGMEAVQAAFFFCIGKMVEIIPFLPYNIHQIPRLDRRWAAVRNQKICVICGNCFYCPQSDKTVTCSPECRREYAKRRSTGRKLPDGARKKISEKAKARDMCCLQAAATEASRRSPKSGRFETNVCAIDWHIVSPEGKHYKFHSLQNWLRNHCEELFGCQPDTPEFHNVRSGLSGVKGHMLGKKYGAGSYKGWTVIPLNEDKPGRN